MSHISVIRTIVKWTGHKSFTGVTCKIMLHSSIHSKEFKKYFTQHQIKVSFYCQPFNRFKCLIFTTKKNKQFSKKRENIFRIASRWMTQIRGCYVKSHYTILIDCVINLVFFSLSLSLCFYSYTFRHYLCIQKPFVTHRSCIHSFQFLAWELEKKTFFRYSSTVSRIKIL